MLVGRLGCSKEALVPESDLVGQESRLRVSPSLPGLLSTPTKHKDLTKPVLPGQANLLGRVWMGVGGGAGAVAGLRAGRWGWELSLHLQVGFFRYKGVEEVIPQFRADAIS